MWRWVSISAKKDDLWKCLAEGKVHVFASASGSPCGFYFKLMIDDTQTHSRTHSNKYLQDFAVYPDYLYR